MSIEQVPFHDIDSLSTHNNPPIVLHFNLNVPTTLGTLSRAERRSPRFCLPVGSENSVHGSRDWIFGDSGRGSKHTTEYGAGFNVCNSLCEILGE